MLHTHVINNKEQAIGILFLIVSFFILLSVTSADRLSFNSENYQETQLTNSSIYPSNLKIKELDIDLSVQPAGINNGKWQASTKGVSFLKTSVLPGVPGNSVFYGHNWPNLLGNLKKAMPGQEIEVTYSDGVIKEFKIEFTQVVTPDQTHIINNTADTRLTLYTCTGFLDSKRFVVTAIPKA